MSEKRKEPLQLKEDKLEVGLARYRKREKNRLPEWVVEFGPGIAVGLLLVVVLGPLWLFSGWFGRSPEPQVGSLPRLKVVSEPIRVWANGSTTQLQSVKVSVANAGPVEALDVRVVARIRSRNFELNGPTSLPSGSSEVFSGDVQAVMKSSDSLTITTSCSNCQ